MRSPQPRKIARRAQFPAQRLLAARDDGQRRFDSGKLPDFLAERVFEPLGMVDMGFEVPSGKRDRFTSYYGTGEAGGLELADGPDGQWSSLPPFPLLVTRLMLVTGVPAITRAPERCNR